MIWQTILLAISAIIFFGFVIFGVKKFGLLSCYSAYGPKWAPEYASQLNPWQVVTFLSAALMMPVILSQSFGNPWQFLGFLAPVCLSCVAASPNYQDGGFYNVLHQIGAWGTVAFIILWTIFVNPWMVLVSLPFLVASVVLGICIRGTWLFWGEMAMYLSTYIILFTML